MSKKRTDPMKKRVVLQFTASFLAIILVTGCSQSDGPATGVHGTLLDLTYSFDENTVFWPTAPGFELTTEFEGRTPDGYYYSAYAFSTSEHGGTHLDAPIHFAEGTLANDQIPLEHLIGPAILIDVEAAAAENRDYLISITDFETWEATHGRIPDGAIVLVRTGFGGFWPDRARYLGTDARGPEAVPDLHFPGLDPDAATWLVNERSIHAFGLDTASIDYGQSTLFESHEILYTANIPGFENVANLDQLPPGGFSIIALPMKIKGGSGGPLRIVAVLP